MQQESKKTMKKSQKRVRPWLVVAVPVSEFMDSSDRNPPKCPIIMGLQDISVSDYKMDEQWFVIKKKQDRRDNLPIFNYFLFSKSNNKMKYIYIYIVFFDYIIIMKERIDMKYFWFHFLFISLFYLVFKLKDCFSFLSQSIQYSKNC